MGFKLALKNEDAKEYIRWKDDTGLYYVARAMTFRSLAARLPVSSETYLKLLDEAAYRNINSRYFFVAESVLNAAAPPGSLEIHSDAYSVIITDPNDISNLFAAFKKGLSLTVQAFNRTATSPYGRYSNASNDAERYFVFNNEAAKEVAESYLATLPAGTLLTPHQLRTQDLSDHPHIWGLNQHYKIELTSDASTTGTPDRSKVQTAQNNLFGGYGTSNAFSLNIPTRRIRFTATIETLQVITDLPRTETQKTVMNGVSASTVAGVLGISADHSYEWLHLSAFALEIADTTRNQDAITDLILGTAETNAQVLLFETQIQNMLMIWGGAMVADICIITNCAQIGSSNKFASWLTNSIQYDVRFRKATADDRAVKMGMTDLDQDEVDASYDPFHFTTTFNPFLAAVPTVVEQYVIQGLLLHHQAQSQSMQPVRADNTLLVTTDGPVLQLKRILPRANKRIERQLEPLNVNLLGRNLPAVRETLGQNQFTTVSLDWTAEPGQSVSFGTLIPTFPNGDQFVFQNAELTIVEEQGKFFMVFIGDLAKPSNYPELQSLWDLLGAGNTMTMNTVMYLEKGMPDFSSIQITSPGFTDMSSPACFTKILTAGGNTLLLSNLGLKINCLKNLDYSPPPVGSMQIVWRTDPYISGMMELYCLNSPLPVLLNAEIKYLPNGDLGVFGSASGVKNLFGLKRLCFDYLSAEFLYTGNPEPVLTAVYAPFVKCYGFTGKITNSATWLISKYNTLSLQDLDDIYNNLAGEHLHVPDWDIQFENATISLATDDFSVGIIQYKRGLHISATVTVNGYTATVNGIYGPDGISFKGAVTNIPQTLPLAQGMTIGALQLTIDLNRENSGFRFTGTLTYQGANFDCVVTMEKDNAGRWYEILCADLHGPAFALSILFPDVAGSGITIAGSVVDNVRFKDAVILASNINWNNINPTYDHNGTPYVVSNGVFLMGVLEELPAVSALLHKRMTGLQIQGDLGQVNTENYSLEVLIPEGNTLQMGEIIQCGPFRLFVQVYPNPFVQMIFTTTLNNIPSPPGQLPFSSTLTLGATSAYGGGSAMTSEVANFLGITGLNARYLSGFLQINYAAFAASGHPDKTDISFMTPLNNTSQPGFMWRVSENPQQDILRSSVTDNTLEGNNTNPVRPVSPAYLRSLIETFVPGLTLSENPAFLNFEKMELYGSPQGGDLEGHTLQAGMNFSATLTDYLGMEIWAYFNNQVSEEDGAPPIGLIGSGQISGFNLDPLAVGGPQGKEATVNLLVSADQQDLRINGSIQFQGYLCDADLVISNSGQVFDLVYPVNDICFIDIHGENTMNNQGLTDFNLSADLNENFLEYLSSLVVAKLNAGFRLLNDGNIEDVMAEQLTRSQARLNANLTVAQSRLHTAEAAAATLLHDAQTELYEGLNEFKNQMDQFKWRRQDAELAFRDAEDAAQAALLVAQNNFNQAVRAAEANLNRATKTNLGLTKSAEQNFLVAQHKWNAYYTDVNATVTALQGKINDLNSGIILLQTKRNEGPDYKKSFYDAEISGLQAERQGLQVLLDTATTNLNGAQDTDIYRNYQSMKGILEATRSSSSNQIQAARTALDDKKLDSPEYNALQTAIADLAGVEIGADYNAWKAVEASGEAARKRGQADLDLSRLKLNNLSQSVEFQTLRTARAAFEVMKTGPAAQDCAALEAGISMSGMAPETRDAFAGELEDAGTQAFFFRSVQISGSFRDVQSWYAGAFQDRSQRGAPFMANFSFSLLGTDHSFGAEVFDLNTLNGFVQRVYEIVLDLSPTTM